jgi:Niemann-Pick C1 protein
MGRLWRSATAAVVLLALNLVSAGSKHEAGRCSIRGTCGKDSFFGPELPCPDNGLAAEPDDDVRKQLVELCGPKWNTGPVCCEGKQVRNSLLGEEYWSLRKQMLF